MRWDGRAQPLHLGKVELSSLPRPRDENEDGEQNAKQTAEAHPRGDRAAAAFRSRVLHRCVHFAPRVRGIAECANELTDQASSQGAPYCTEKQAGFDLWADCDSSTDNRGAPGILALKILSFFYPQPCCRKNIGSLKPSSLALHGSLWNCRIQSESRVESYTLFSFSHSGPGYDPQGIRQKLNNKLIFLNRGPVNLSQQRFKRLVFEAPGLRNAQVSPQGLFTDVRDRVAEFNVSFSWVQKMVGGRISSLPRCKADRGQHRFVRSNFLR